MARFSVVLYRPDSPRFIILKAYEEVLHSVAWGLQALGHEVTVRRNQIDAGATNIVFGWLPALQAGHADQFPPGTILYNLEQDSAEPLRGKPAMELAAARFQIWDYSQANIARWNELAPRYPVFYAPISYAPVLERLPPAQEDLDLLFIGSLSSRRAETITLLDLPPTTSLMTVSNVWDAQRDALLARARVLLNISNRNLKQEIYEVVRVSYYLANRKAVLSEAVPWQKVEPDLAGVLRFADRAEFGAITSTWLLDPDLRRRYAEACYEVFRQRDIKQVMRQFFGSNSPSVARATGA